MQQLIDYLMTSDDLTKNKEKTITKNVYDKFCREFIFDRVIGKSFGEAFCQKFGFNDIFLRDLKDETAKHHIEKLGYIKDDTLSN